jgi:hypothetical protein
MKNLRDRFLSTAPPMHKQTEFHTKLKFDPSNLSTPLLKRYLADLFNLTDAEQLLPAKPPEQYTKDPDNLTNYQVLRELSLISIKEWKRRLDHDGDVQALYLNEETVSQDSRYFYEKWKIIQNEVGNHDKQMSFFRLVSEIVSDLSSRNYIEIDSNGIIRTLKDDLMHQNVDKLPLTSMNNMNPVISDCKPPTDPLDIEWGFQGDIQMEEMKDE